MPTGDKEQSFFDGVDVSLAGIAELAHGQDNAFLEAGLGRMNAAVEQAMGEFSAAHPEKIAPVLADGLKQTNALAAQVSASTLSEQAKYDVLRELALKQEQFQHAIVLALGVSLEATAGPKRAPGGRNAFNNGPQESFAYAIPGQEFAVTVHLYNPQPSALTLNRVWLETPGGEKWTSSPESSAPAAVPAGAAVDQRIDTKVPDDAAATRPYFTRPNDEQPYYDILDPRYRNLSLAPYPLAGWAEFSYQGVPVRLGQVVQTVRRETGQGVVLNPLMITPAVSVRIAPQAGITPLGKKSFALSALVHSEAAAGSKGTVQAATARGLARGAGHRAIFAGAGGRGAKRGLPGVSRSPGGKALHGDGAGGVRRPGISRGICHHRISRAASIQFVFAGDLSNVGREREGRARAARRVRDRDGRRCAVVAREYRNQDGVPEPAGPGAGRLAEIRRDRAGRARLCGASGTGDE